MDCADMKTILETEEGQPKAKEVLSRISIGKNLSDAENQTSFSCSELAASAVYFLGTQDYKSADLILSQLEKSNTGAPVLFLRGEYHLLLGNNTEAEQFFDQAARKNRAFWPAFYRSALMAAEDNRVRYEYKIKKACDSLELGREFHYECFMGGFSPDYFKRVLSRRLEEKK